MARPSPTQHMKVQVLVLQLMPCMEESDYALGRQLMLMTDYNFIPM